MFQNIFTEFGSNFKLQYAHVTIETMIFTATSFTPYVYYQKKTLHITVNDITEYAVRTPL